VIQIGKDRPAFDLCSRLIGQCRLKCQFWFRNPEIFGEEFGYASRLRAGSVAGSDMAKGSFYNSTVVIVVWSEKRPSNRHLSEEPIAHGSSSPASQVQPRLEKNGRRR
jgi:hypothetical protein